MTHNTIRAAKLTLPAGKPPPSSPSPSPSPSSPSAPSLSPSPSSSSSPSPSLFRSSPLSPSPSPSPSSPSSPSPSPSPSPSSPLPPSPSQSASLPSPPSPSPSLSPPPTDFESLLSTAYASDPFPSEVLELLRMGARHCKTISLAKCSKTAVRLRYRSKLYIPTSNDLRLHVLCQAHDIPTAGNPGRFKTLELIAREYFWPGMRKDVERCV